MRPLVLVLLLVVLAMTASGCAGGSEPTAQPTTEPPAATAAEEPQPPPAQEEPSRLFTEADLPDLALQTSDAPDGLRYVEKESGRKTFEDVGIVVDDQIAEAEELGLTGVYEVIFDSTTSDLRLASRLWLFTKAAGAERWLADSKADSELFLEKLSAPQIAESSWAARGNISGSEVISHAFREGNVVVVTTFSTQSEPLSEPEALAIAQEAAARVQVQSR